MDNKLWIALGVVALLIFCFGCVPLATFGATQGNLNTLQQVVLSTQAKYEGAKTIVAQKIDGAFNLADRQIAHEDRAYKALADARKAFNDATAAGNDPEIVRTAGAFNLQFKAIAESNPAFASGPVVQQAMNTMEEAVNEIFTAFRDNQTAVQAYNTYRRSLYLPVIVGNILGYPESYKYYQGTGKDFDIKQHIPEAPGK